MICDKHEGNCPKWCIIRIDTQLVAEGWVPISAWWWGVINSLAEYFVRNVVLRGGRRLGKSTTICRIAVAETLDEKHIVPPGDIGYFAIVSATKEQAQDRLKTCGQILKALNIPHKETADKIILTDRNVGIRVFAATLRGVVSFTCIGALCDEEARWLDTDSGTNPAAEVLGTLRPTMATMPHAQMWHVSAPWSTLDVHHKMFIEGDTPAQRVFFAETWVGNPTLTEADTHNLEPDYATWLREYAAQPMSSDETKFFGASFIEAATRIPQFGWLHPVERVVAGGDFAFRRNSSAMVTLQKYTDNTCSLTACEERIPGAKPLVPSETITDLAGIAVRRGADCLACDLHYIETVRETVEDLPIALLEFPTSSDEISLVYVRTRVWLSEGKIDLSRAPPRLIEQLKDTTSKPTDGAGLIIKNKTKGDAHGDLVSALVCAVWALSQDVPDDKLSTGARRYGRGEAKSNGDDLSDYPPSDWE